VYITFSGCY